ncbi:MucBP domain-containing protein [Candidatus Saccharibacteria bacterium]|nr:MucBP domain-containing protein [Candidatus Saccharibacteria bacterium]
MKKLHTSAMLAVTAAFIASPIIGVTDASAAASVTYAGFHTLNRNTLNNTYSYSKIYYTENTKVTNVKVGAAGTLNAVMTTTSNSIGSGAVRPGETYTALIEDSTATDPNGNPLDVLYKVSDVHAWTDELDDDGNPKANASISFQKNITGSGAETHPEESIEESTVVHAGDPIIAWNSTVRADSLFTVQFCKKGTYVVATDSCTIATNMANVSSAMWDFDVPNLMRAKDSDGNYIIKDDGWFDYTEDGDKLFHGNEGILPTVGSNTIYRNTNKTADGTVLSTEQNGFSIKDINGSAYNGIWFGNSIMVTSTGLSGSWSYRYSGRGCGIGFLFGSAVPYEIPKPKKTVNKTTAKIGDEVTYRITQEVPNNYSTEADIIQFMSLWSNYSAIPQNKGYSALRISDSFDNSLILPSSSEIKITNEKGTNVTSNFTITVSGQKVEAVAKNANTLDFYGHTYTIIVKAKVGSPISGSPVRNLAQTVYTPVDGSDTTLNSDPVETKIYHTVTTKYVNDETGEEIADSVSADYEHGKSYDTDESDDVPEKFVLVKTPDNASGTVDQDIEVIYRYLPPKKVTARYIDDETGKPIGDPISGEYPQGDDYETIPLPDDPKGYKLVKMPDNAKGVMGNKDIEVIYRYRKVKNPNTADISTKAFIGVIVASIMGGGLFFGLKRRR